MEELMERFLKIQSEYFRRRQLLFILDLISLFSILYAIFVIFQVEYFLKAIVDVRIPINIIQPILAFIIAIIGAYLLHRNDHKINMTLLIENKYPEMKEKLRTAYDNISETNVIVDSLKSLVSSGLAIVSASTLLSTTVVVTKIIVVVIFVSGAAFISFNADKYAIPVDTLTSISETITGKPEDSTNLTIDMVGNPEDIEKAQASGGGNIFAKPKIASIEGRNIDLTIYGGEGPGFEVRDVSQTQDQFTKSAAFPVDVLGSNVSDGGFSDLMKKTETDKKLIQDYAVERSKI